MVQLENTRTRGRDVARGGLIEREATTDGRRTRSMVATWVARIRTRYLESREVRRSLRRNPPSGGRSTGARI